MKREKVNLSLTAKGIEAMTAATLSLENGTQRMRKPARKSKAKRGKAMVAPLPRTALGITLGMGVGIPALTLSLSTIAGRLASSGHVGLGCGVGLVGATVLTVSLSHLAWAVQDISKSSRWASWALAVAVDCGLVACEAVQVFAPGIVDTLASAVMIGVTAASMVLNVWAFLRHR